MEMIEVRKIDLCCNLITKFLQLSDFSGPLPTMRHTRMGNSNKKGCKINDTKTERMT